MLSEAERGPVWRTDGAPDYNRRLVRDTPYAELELRRLARRELRIETRPVSAGRLFVRFRCEWSDTTR